MGEKVAILGASPKPERYAYKAFQLLKEYGHTPLLVNPHSTVKEIEGYLMHSKLSDLNGFDTLTLYVGPAISSQLESEILAAKPKRVIFNPGTENPSLAAKLVAQGAEVVEGCTLVMLKTNQF
jgi:predicted CoA-binding protein